MTQFIFAGEDKRSFCRSPLSGTKLRSHPDNFEASESYFCSLSLLDDLGFSFCALLQHLCVQHFHGIKRTCLVSVANIFFAALSDVEIWFPVGNLCLASLHQHI